MFFGRRRDRHLAYVEYFWAQALQRAKLRPIRIHDLRHSYAATHVARGTSLHVIGKLLGHRDPKTSPATPICRTKRPWKRLTAWPRRSGRPPMTARPKPKGKREPRSPAQTPRAKATARYNELAAEWNPRRKDDPDRSGSGDWLVDKPDLPLDACAVSENPAAFPLRDPGSAVS